MSNENCVGSTIATQVTVVESEACHFCDDANRALAALATSYPLAIQTIDVRTPEGTALMRSHRASMSPLVLLDGVFFSHGRLPRRKLLKVLAARYGPADTVTPGGPIGATTAGGGRRG